MRARVHALADDVVGAVGRGDVAHDVGDGGDPVEVVRPGLLGLGAALQDDADRALLAQRLLRGGDGLRPADRDRRDGAGKQHHLAHGDDDQRVLGDLHVVIGLFVVHLFVGHDRPQDLARRSATQPSITKRLMA
ncbi:hypothetical protein ACVMFA_001140 [Bradyrhizobium liaoningense]